MSTRVAVQVAELITPLVEANGWDIKRHTVKQVLTLSKPTVYIEHTNAVQLDMAPVGHVLNTCVVTILDHHTNYDTAEDAIDAAVLELITELDGSDRLTFVKADKTEVVETYLGWAITLTFISEKEA